MIDSEAQARVATAIRRSRELWGAEFHMRLVQEECAELIAAINQYDRGRGTLEEVAEEVADVVLVIGAARAIVGETLVDGFVLGKLQRLEERIAKNSEHHAHVLRKR